jgi:UDP-glucose 4-epimerase
MEQRSVQSKKMSKEIIVITGSSGLIGSALIQRLSEKYTVVGLDRKSPPYPSKQAENVNFDITDEESIHSAMERISYCYGRKIASVIHLAAYYDFAEKDSPKYHEINVEGTKNFLTELQNFDVEQFLFSSSNLIYKPTEPGVKINEDCPVEANWGYPESKVLTEDLIKKNNKDIPAVFLRIAGIYTDVGHSIPITQQIKRIYDKELLSHFYSGDVTHGDVFVHLEDVVDAVEKAVDQRTQIPNAMAFNIGEPTSPTYQELQDTIGNLLHGKDWETFEMPKALAKAGAWARDLVSDPFIKPWMVDRAGAHYELDIDRAKAYLDWEPSHRVMDTLPKMIKNLKQDPEAWFRENNLD